MYYMKLLSLSLSPSLPLTPPSFSPSPRLLSTAPSLQIWTLLKHLPSLVSGQIIALTQCTGLDSRLKKISYRLVCLLFLFLSLSPPLSLPLSLSLSFILSLCTYRHTNICTCTYTCMYMYVWDLVFFVLAYFLTSISLFPFSNITVNYTVVIAQT